ncbi:MAG: hypothetical protein KGH88_05900 [Thaumarchaeota archaeon]|nr:hypothetical protein [Nitrososphaerota archaeon]
MVKKFVTLFFTCMLLVGSISLTSYYPKPNSESISLPLAFAQVSGSGNDSANNLGGPQDPSSMDAGDPGDPGSGANATDLPPPDTSNNLGNPDQNGTLGNPTGVTTTTPGANSTNVTTFQSPSANQPVPEFGPLPALVLGAAIMAALMIGQRAFFKSKPYIR